MDEPVLTSPNPPSILRVLSRMESIMAAPQPALPPPPDLPLPDLPQVMEMQIGLVNKLADVHRAKAEGRPVVWSSVIMPQEIMRAMNVATLYQEILGGYASIFGLGGKYCQIAEEAGLSRDVCAVHRTIVGVALAEERDAFFQMAFTEPDLAIGNNFACMSESHSFKYIVKKFGTPHYVVDTPINTWGPKIPEHAVDYYAGQLRGAIAFLESHGYKMDWDRLKEEVAISKQVNTVLGEIDKLKQAVPHPIRAYDSIIAAMFPISLPPEMLDVRVFEDLRDALRARVENGEGVVDEEKLRLLWIGIPPLCDFKLLNYTESKGAVVVKSMLEYITGFTVDPDMIDPDRPLESLALAQLASPANPLYPGAIDYLTKAARDYKVDGVISVVKRTCGLVPGMQRLTKDAIWKELKIPALVFDLDGIDEREYDEASTKAQLDAFVETLLARKGA